MHSSARGSSSGGHVLERGQGASDGGVDTTGRGLGTPRVEMGFDGSFNGDTTALVAVSIADPPVVDVVAFWAPRPGEQVPSADVEDAIPRPAAGGASARSWPTSSAGPARCKLLDREGLPVVEFPQAPQLMTPATARFQAVVNRTLRHAGDSDLAAHVGHAVARTDSRGTRITKVSKHSTRRIDLAVAAVMAHARAAELAHVPAVQVSR